MGLASAHGAQCTMKSGLSQAGGKFGDGPGSSEKLPCLWTGCQVNKPDTTRAEWTLPDKCEVRQACGCPRMLTQCVGAGKVDTVRDMCEPTRMWVSKNAHPVCGG